MWPKSKIGLYPERLVVIFQVTNESVKEDIRDIVEAEERINYEKRMGKQWTADLKPLNTNWEKPYLTRAPALVLLFKQVWLA